MTVVIPTLAADAALVDCIRSLQAQTYRDFEVIVVDNSGKRLVRTLNVAGPQVRVIENDANAGFGTAINQGWRASTSRYVASLNDDAAACADWLQELVRTAESADDIGMVASRVLLGAGERVDSAGMLICADGSSKQRGHGASPAEFGVEQEALFPSGSAALYRRSMLVETGGFDDSFFLYCEDTDLGLRGQWAGWRCLYQPRAMVLHRYSHSAGRASALKAYYVERNRLFVLIKNLPLRLLWRAPFVSLGRYLWHLWFLTQGRGAAAEFSNGRGGAWLAWFVLKAHVATALALPRLLRDRARIRQTARRTPGEMAALLSRHAITAKEVAAL